MDFMAKTILEINYGTDRLDVGLKILTSQKAYCGHKSYICKNISEALNIIKEYCDQYGVDCIIVDTMGIGRVIYDTLLESDLGNIEIKRTNYDSVLSEPILGRKFEIIPTEFIKLEI